MVALTAAVRRRATSRRTSALAKLGAVTAGINPRLAPDESAARPRTARARPRHRRRLRARARDGRGTRTAAHRTTTASPRSCSRRARPASPRARCSPTASSTAITTIDIGRRRPRGAAGSPMLASTQFCHIGFMTKLPWYLRLGCTLVLQDRWRAANTLALVADAPDAVDRWRRRADRAAPPRARLRPLRRLVGEDDRRRRRTVTTRDRARGARTGSAPPTRSATRRPSPAASAPAPRSTPPTRRRCYTVGRPRPGVEIRIDERQR